MTNSDLNELLPLIHAHRVGSLRVEQAKELETLVANDPHLMKAFVEYQLLQAGLELQLTDSSTIEPLALAPSVTKEPTIEAWRRKQSADSTFQSVSRMRLRRAIWFVASCAAIFLVAMIVWQSWPQPTADFLTVVELEGNVFVEQNETRQSLKSGDIVLPGQTMATGNGDSSAVLHYADSTSVQLNSNSQIRFDQSPTGGKQLFITQGVAVTDVAPQAAGSPMMITTPHATIRVLGTRLISSASAFTTRIELQEGKVEITRRADGESLKVSQGSFAEVTRQIVPLVAKPLPRELVKPNFSIRSHVQLMQFNSSDRQLVTANPSELRFWSPEGELVNALPHSVAGVREASLSVNGSLLAIGGAREAVVLNLSTEQVIREIRSDKEGVRTIAIAPDGMTVAFVDKDVRREEALVWLYDVKTGKRIRSLKANAHEVVSLHFSPTGRTVAGGTRNGRVIVWNIDTSQPRIVWPGDVRIRRVRFSPDGLLLASCDHRGAIRVWNCDTWQEKLIVEDIGRDPPSLALSPDSRWLAVGTQDGQVRIWDIDSGEECLTIRVHDRRHVRHIAFTGNRSLAASCGIANLLTFWQLNEESDD